MFFDIDVFTTGLFIGLFSLFIAFIIVVAGVSFIFKKKIANKKLTSGTLLIRYDDTDKQYYVFSEFSKPLNEIIKCKEIVMNVDFSHE